MDDRVAVGGFRPLEEIKRAEMGDGKLSRD